MGGGPGQAGRAGEGWTRPNWSGMGWGAWVGGGGRWAAGGGGNGGTDSLSFAGWDSQYLGNRFRGAPEPRIILLCPRAKSDHG